MFELCVFDLDETLVRTADMQAVREACKNSEDPGRIQAVLGALDLNPSRRIYSLELLGHIRATYPALKLAVFTRSPRSYARTVLAWAYPGFTWDAVVAYEDVSHTKPYGHGIYKAASDHGIKYCNQVLVVGDGDVDVRAAYHAGVRASADRSAWPWHFEREHWHTLELVPDAFLLTPDDVLDVLKRPDAFLPELERLLAGCTERARDPRFDKIGHFLPKTISNGEKTAYQIFVCGRSFAHYQSLNQRRGEHALSTSIEANKDSDVFPAQWLEAIRNFISSQYRSLFQPVNLLVTSVPHRPGRKPRLETLLQQLGAFIAANPIKSFQPTNVTIVGDMLAYKDGVKSNHGEYLSPEQRAINVRDHLYVQRTDLAEGARILVLDDVVTTGASLIYASKYLKDAGAADVTCLALAKNVSDVLK